MVSRALVSVAWLVALSVLVGVARLRAGSFDIYLRDRYYVVSKTSLILLILLLFVLPLIALAVRVFRSTH